MTKLGTAFSVEGTAHNSLCRSPGSAQRVMKSASLTGRWMSWTLIALLARRARNI